MSRQPGIRRVTAPSNEKLRAALQRARDEQTWVGTLDEIQSRFVYLWEVRPDASWHPEPLGYRLRAITEVETDTRYLRALAASAAPRPGN